MRGKDGAEGGGVSRSECGRGETGKGRERKEVKEWKSGRVEEWKSERVKE